MKIGLMGGTFDPIHNGHLAMAEEARARLNLAKVLFVPAGQPWLKMASPVSAAEHRWEMVRLATAGKLYFEISTGEVERAGPSYTVDTVDELEAQLDSGDELFLILGWDSLKELPQWHEPSRLIKLCYLVAIPRLGYLPPNLKALEVSIPGISQRVIFLDGPQIDISATEIRNRVAQGLSIRHHVPKPVNSYIKQRRLYITR